MAFVVKQDKAPDPVGIGLFRANAVMFEADFLANKVEEFRLVIHRFPIV
jgi:hypothetical protein